MSEDDYWSKSLAELERWMTAWSNANTAEQKKIASATYTLGILVGRAIVGKYPDLEEVFPDLFKAECEEIRMKQSQANFEAFAARWNSHFQKETSNE